ncbi:MAG: ABC transporter ATP-binding protein [bacterium]
MTTDRPIVELRDISLCYRLAKQKIPSLKEYAIHFVRGALAYEELWALRDVSLSIAEGETVGIVGRNGAGKSTMLKVISGVLKPTRGKVRRRGWVAPILELGTGFDFELTGQENIYLNALLLGRQRREIDERLDEIVEFSGLRDFIRSPIRNYSSGMLARLGFSIATAWKPDLLILDEVLGVGDARFLKRCEQKIGEFREAGTTILIVSHDPESVRKNCRRAVWLEQGKLALDGPTDEVLDAYGRFSEGKESRAAG